MIQTKKCPKCGGGNIAGPHNVHGGEHHIKIDLPGISTATIIAITCANCGYTEMYSDRGGLANINRSGRWYSREADSGPTFDYVPAVGRKCKVCGTVIMGDDRYCPECGSMV